MASSAGHHEYDENLLASAPAATKAQLQGGYNADLLHEKSTPSPSPPSRRTTGDVEAARPAAGAPLPPPSKTPFYRTRKGIIIIAVAFIVILAAVVGGAVGGTRNKSNNSAASDQTGGQLTTTQDSGTSPATSSASFSQIVVSATSSNASVSSTVPTVPTPSPSDGQSGGAFPSSVFVTIQTSTPGLTIDPSATSGLVTLPSLSPPPTEAVGTAR